MFACEHLSFSRAATEMHITQSAFSQLILNLETQLGVRLFDRTTRRVALTAAGELMQRRLKLSLESIDQACEEALAVCGLEQGSIRVGATSSLATGVVAQTLEQLHEQYPRISVSLQEGYSEALADMVGRGGIDFAVCSEVKSAPGLDFEHLFDDEMVLVTRRGSPMAGRELVKWSDLASEPLVLTGRGTRACEQVLAALQQHGVTAPSKCEVASVQAGLTLVRAGFGSAFAYRAVLRYSEMSGLETIRIAEPALRRTGVYRRPDRELSPLSRRFLELIKANLASVS